MAIIGDIKIKWNETGLNNVMSEGEDFIDKVADDVLENAKTIVPVDTGRLKDSLHKKDGETKYERLVGTDTTTYACIFGAQTRIKTKNGTKTIGMVKIGDEVLTQTGDFKKVLKQIRHKAKDFPNLIDIEFEYRKNKTHKITLTDNHKILIYRNGRNKWIESKDLLLTDKVWTLIKTDKRRGTGKSSINICLNCKNSFRRYLTNLNQKFCSDKCRQEYWNIKGNNPHVGMKRSAESKRKMSESAKKRFKNNPRSHPNYNIRKKSKFTKYEQWVKDWLDSRGIEYIFNYNIGNKWVDFYCPKTNEIYEPDGAYWHKDQQKDIDRDKYLLTIDPLLKITHIHFYDKRFTNIFDPNPYPNVFYVVCNPNTNSYINMNVFKKTDVVSVYKWNYLDKKQKHNLHNANLYDLSIQDIHSYYANGLIISNCHVEFGTINTPMQAYLRPSMDEVISKL